MISRFLFVTLFLLAGLGTGGCALLHRKSKDSKSTKDISSSSTPVADMEKDFKDRWVAHRVTELTAGGMAAEQAQAKAIQEYAEAYKFTKSAR